MSSPWRTDTVVAICRSMREAGDYSACPILADALQDADFDSQDHWVVSGSHLVSSGTLNMLRLPEVPREDLERVVALIYSEESAQAVERIRNLADQMGPPGYPSTFGFPSDTSDDMTYERLMEAARKHIDEGDDGLGDGSMDWSNLGGESVNGKKWDEPDFKSVEDQFWDDWSLVTGRPRPEGHQDAIFRCSC